MNMKKVITFTFRHLFNNVLLNGVIRETLQLASANYIIS